MAPTEDSGAARRSGEATEAGRTKPRQTRDAAATRARILKAAEKEFAKKGLKGTRIDAIAKRATCNKALIYHYFGSKEDLFSAVLEVTYEKIRAAERKLDLAHRSPEQAMQELIGFSFDYVSQNPEFISLINDENMHGGVHVVHSARARDLNSPLVALIEDRRFGAIVVFSWDCADDVVRDRLGAWTSANGFKPDKTTIEIRGHCASCLAH